LVNDVAKTDLTKRIAVLGAPIDIGASQRGTLMGPAALQITDRPTPTNAIEPGS
jgi:arginase